MGSVNLSNAVFTLKNINQMLKNQKLKKPTPNVINLVTNTTFSSNTPVNSIKINSITIPISSGGPIKNLDQTKAYQELKAIDTKSISLKKLLNPERIKKYNINNGPINYNYATTLTNDKALNKLQKLADELNLTGRYKDILAGKIMNLSEKRKVLHHMCRNSKNKGMYGKEQQKIAEFAKKVHNGEIRGATGKKITDIVQIGIGGSDLGPRAVYEALRRKVSADKGKLPIRAHFISNVDPDDANSVLEKIDFETALIIVVSKSGTTQETLTNLKFVQEKAIEKGLKKEDLKKHFLAVTGKGSPLDNPKKYLASFYIDSNIGGRYSVTSAVGGTVLSLAFGPEVFEKFLQGAAKIDEASKEKDITKNAALMAALIGVWNRNFLNLNPKAIIPYSAGLGKFGKHIQQLDCESNGKSVNQYGRKVNYKTGAYIMTAPGTDAQHSFFQEIHQGTTVLPIEFMISKKPQIAKDLKCFGSTSQEKLKANQIAQIIAMAVGQKDEKNLNQNFPGNRPTSLIYYDQLTPEALGAILAFYENKVMFQGLAWNLNSFDQPGVQLGKKLAKQVLKKGGPDDKNLKAMYALVN
ncbi:glucose-6-phosphate isomerase [Candidatus Margulisiibacteriota bacterium]